MVTVAQKFFAGRNFPFCGTPINAVLYTIGNVDKDVPRWTILVGQGTEILIVLGHNGIKPLSSFQFFCTSCSPGNHRVA